MQNIRILEKTGKGWWMAEEIGSLLSLKRPQVAVFCSRALRRGDLVRLKRGLFTLPGWLAHAPEDEIFKIANLLQTPSYVSFSTILSKAGVSSQLPAYICESAVRIRSAGYEVEGFSFSFIHLPVKLFTGFKRDGGFFAAEPEKAFLDAVYMTSLGRYSLDRAALDTSSLNMARLKELAEIFPERARKLAADLLETA